MNVLVTGASGFVGSSLVPYLAGRGYDVFSAGRQDAADPFSAECWGKVLESSAPSAVVHLVGKTHAPDAGDRSALPSYRRINVDITSALLEACRSTGVKKFVYMSSIKAVGEEAHPDDPFTEESPCRPEDCYGISKLEAERAVLERFGNVEPVIFRPSLIYGKGVKGNFLRLLKALERGIPLPLGSVRNARSLLYAGNLASGIGRALGGDTGGGIFHIADDEAPSTPELLRLLAAALEKPCRLFPFPPGMLEAIAALAGRRETVRKLTGSLAVSAEKAKRVLGWRPEVSLEEGLKETCCWFSSVLSEGNTGG